MKIKYGDVNVVEQLAMVFDRVASRKEDDDLLLDVFLEERDKEEEPPAGRTHDVALGERVDCARVLFVVDVNVQRPGAKRYSGEVGHFGGLCCREEHRLAVFWRV